MSKETHAKRPWLQYVTLLMATLSMAFSLITAFHPFGIGESKTTDYPNFSTQNNNGFPGGGGGNFGGTQSNNTTTNSSDSSSITTNGSTSNT